MKYFLVGYMACGKTRKASDMAELMGLRRLDLDSYIESREHESVTEIFRDRGEQTFRTLETRYLQEVCELYDNFVLSCGGGTPCYNGNMDFMNSQGETIFLNTPENVIVERLIRGRNRRPLISKLSDEEIADYVKQHLAQRLPFYNMSKQIITE